MVTPVVEVTVVGAGTEDVLAAVVVAMVVVLKVDVVVTQVGLRTVEAA